MRTTVGPLPPEVYWRRRLAVIGVLVVALVGVRACASGDTSRAGNQPVAKGTVSTPSDGTAEHPFRPVFGKSPTPSAAPNAASASPRPVTGPCTNAELMLTAAAGAREYPVGSKPKLIMTVRNLSARTCARDLGPVARELIVTSGPAHTWSTDDCHAGAASSLVMLKPGATQTFTEIWDGQRSEPKCRGSRPVATAGTYLVQARLGSLRSETFVFRLE